MPKGIASAKRSSTRSSQLSLLLNKVGHYKSKSAVGRRKYPNSQSEDLVGFAWLIDAQRDLISDSDAVTFQGYYFLG